MKAYAWNVNLSAFSIEELFRIKKFTFHAFTWQILLRILFALKFLTPVWYGPYHTMPRWPVYINVGWENVGILTPTLSQPKMPSAMSLFRTSNFHQNFQFLGNQPLEKTIRENLMWTFDFKARLKWIFGSYKSRSSSEYVLMIPF